MQWRTTYNQRTQVTHRQAPSLKLKPDSHRHSMTFIRNSNLITLFQLRSCNTPLWLPQLPIILKRCLTLHPYTNTTLLPRVSRIVTEAPSTTSFLVIYTRTARHSTEVHQTREGCGRHKPIAPQNISPAFLFSTATITEYECKNGEGSS